MRLKKVVHRKPVPFQPHKKHPEYLLCYVVETLECGHKVTTQPECDPLIAIRRDCKDCSSNLLEFPSVGKKPEKKAA